MSWALDAALCTLIIAVGLATVLGRSVFRSIVFFIAYGLLMSVAWVRLDAVDVALAEAAIGAGLTGVLFLTAYGRLARTVSDEAAQGPVHLPAALACGVLASLLARAWFTLPVEERPVRKLVEALPRAGVENPVTAVLLNFRAWDTLLESIVLLAALIGLWMLAREKNWQDRLGLPQHVRPGGVMAGFGRMLPPVGFLVGVYLVYIGADRPGGAFQGGTVLAAVGLVAAMAGLVRPPRIAEYRWRLALVVGPSVFILAGLAGAVLATGFLVLPEPAAGTAIFVIEVALAISIAVTLVFLVLGPPEGKEGG